MFWSTVKILDTKEVWIYNIMCMTKRKISESKTQIISLFRKHQQIFPV